MEPSGAFCENNDKFGASRNVESTNPEIFLQASKVKSDSLLVVVSITADFQTGVAEDGGVVSP